MKSQAWLHGLVAATVGGFSGALESGITLIVVAPETFNLNAGLKKTLFTMLIFSLLSGAKCAAAYLKQSPVPPVWTQETETVVQQTTVTKSSKPVDAVTSGLPDSTKGDS
ncbi:MAG TPA: hypothetical protein VNH83_12650 [Bryobacteraceae bacterium]|nr:hypothetical protein [Bryobacteraceae bacterium]